MRSLVLVAVMFAALRSARADGFYFSQGVGATTVKDELASHEADTKFANSRLAIGMRRGPWALEGVIGMQLPTISDAESPGLTTTSLDLKYLQPLAQNLELYVRGSVGYAWADGELANYAGRGLGVGAGVQLKGKGSVLGLLWAPLFFLVNKGPMMTGALYIDDAYDFYRLHDGNRTAIDAQLTHFTFGLALGSDF